MRLEDWMPIYRCICEDFGFSADEDLQAAKILAGMMGDRGEAAIARIRKGFPRSVLVCGGAPKLSEELSSMNLDRFIAVADSATSLLVEAGVQAGAIVTDLDGVVEDQIELNRAGTTVFVHAHGDNVRALEKYVPLFEGPLVGTCQCEPPEGLVNFGGFTDGDRAVCICAALGAERIYLAGFDFQDPAEKPGRRLEVKRRKLAWAERILRGLSGEGVRIFDATTEREMF